VGRSAEARLRPPGWTAGWREYRYGPRLKPPGKKARKLGIAHRDRLAKLVADLTRRGIEAGGPSRFLYEAACRAGIRSGLCVSGWRWTEADAAACDAVSRGLAIAGAVRPSWIDGQPEYVPIERTRCQRCGRPMSEYGRRFCSHICSTAQWYCTSLINEVDEGEAYDAAVWESTRFRTVRS
jgi:hypothetical protein